MKLHASLAAKIIGPVLLILTASLHFDTSLAGDSVDSKSATLSGIVIHGSEDPLDQATVFVYSARLKKAYAIVCPTCWVDCG